MPTFECRWKPGDLVILDPGPCGNIRARVIAVRFGVEQQMIELSWNTGGVLNHALVEANRCTPPLGAKTGLERLATEIYHELDRDHRRSDLTMSDDIAQVLNAQGWIGAPPA